MKQMTSNFPKFTSWQLRLQSPNYSIAVERTRVLAFLESSSPSLTFSGDIELTTDHTGAPRVSQCHLKVTLQPTKVKEQSWGEQIWSIGNPPNLNYAYTNKIKEASADIWSSSSNFLMCTDTPCQPVCFSSKQHQNCCHHLLWFIPILYLLYLIW